MKPHAPKQQVPVPWTVMVFMAAAGNLEPHAAIDIAEMERVDGGDKVKVVVQIVRSSRPPERFLIEAGRCQSCGSVSDEQITKHRARRGATGPTHERLAAAANRTGSPDVLGEFLDWTVENHPAQHYLLVLWGHFIGVGFAPHDDDALLLCEMSEVLAYFKERIGKKLDILGGDTCSLAFAEAAFELKDSVEYMVASELPVQFQGWKYDLLLDAIVKHRGTISPRELGKAIVDTYIDSYKPPSVSMTMLNLEAAGPLDQVFTNLVKAVKDASDADLIKILRAFDKAAHGKIRALIDLRDLCAKLETATKNDALREAAQAVIQVLEQRDNGEGLIVLNRHSNLEIRDLHGIGVFAPNVTDRRDWYLQRISRKVYNGLALVRDSHWGRLVFAFFDNKEGQPSN